MQLDGAVSGKKVLFLAIISESTAIKHDRVRFSEMIVARVSYRGTYVTLWRQLFLGKSLYFLIFSRNVPLYQHLFGVFAFLFLENSFIFGGCFLCR